MILYAITSIFYAAWAVARQLLPSSFSVIEPPLQLYISGRERYKSYRRYLYGITTDFQICAMYVIDNTGKSRKTSMTELPSLVDQSEQMMSERPPRAIIFYKFGDDEEEFAIMVDLTRMQVDQNPIPYTKTDVDQHVDCDIPFVSAMYQDEDVTDLLIKYYGPKRNLYLDVDFADFDLANVVDSTGKLVFADHTDENTITVIKNDMMEYDIKPDAGIESLSDDGDT